MQLSLFDCLVSGCHLHIIKQFINVNFRWQSLQRGQIMEGELHGCEVQNIKTTFSEETFQNIQNKDKQGVIFVHLVV